MRRQSDRSPRLRRWSLAIPLVVGLRRRRRARRAAPRRPPARPTTIGQGEGQLNLIAWEGYTQPQWVKPFEQQTGCQVHAKYAGSSDEMVTLMRQGGGSQYDMVSASGDASLRLIRGGDVAAGQRQPDPGLEELHPAAPVAAAQHGQRRPLRDLAAVGSEHAALQHAEGQAGADELGVDLRPQVQGRGHGPRQPDPDRRRGAVPVEDAAEPRHHRPLRAHRSSSSTRRSSCSSSSGR